MDIQALAQQMVSFLMPMLPHLLKIGDKAAEEVGKKLGGESWERAKALWERLRCKKAVEQMAQTAAALPDNQALREALREEIARALAEDPALAQEHAHLLQQTQGTGRTVTASGSRSVAIGGNVSGSVIVTGDKNKINKG